MPEEEVAGEVEVDLLARKEELTSTSKEQM